MSALQFLLLEANCLDAAIVKATLLKGGIECELRSVETRANVINALETATFDLIVSDAALPDFDGMEALETARRLCPQTPFIFVSASVGEERAIDALEQGAAGYVLKHRLERLVPCVQRVLQQEQIYSKAAGDRACWSLRQKEAKYQTLFESMDTGFCICEMLFDRNGEPADYRFLEVNTVFGKLTGLEQATGKTVLELIPNLEADWFRLYGSVVQTGKSVEFENQSLVMNRWFSVNAFCIGEPQSNQFAILFTDITQRKQAEQVRDRFLAIGSDLQVITGNNGYFQWISPTFEGTLGWTKDEMLARPWSAFVHPDDVPASVSETDSLFSGNETFAFENRYRHKDGSYRWFLWRAQPYPAEQVIYGAAVDITEAKRIDDDRQQVEMALRDSEEQFRRMADHAPFMVWVTDSTGSCTYLSQSWYDFTGQTPATGLGFGWLERTHPDDRLTAERTFLEANQRQEGLRLEYRLQRQDGAYRWVIDAANPWFGAKGVFKGYIGSVIDITDRKQTEQALQKSEEQSRNILESITDAFFAVDEHWQFTYVNQTAYTLVSRTPGDLIGKCFWDEFPSVNDSEFEQMHRRVMRDRGAETITEFYPDHDRWYEVRSYPAVNGITMYFTNVTDRIQAEAAIRLSETRFRRIFECNMVGMGLWDRSGGMIAANDALLEIIGYTRQDLEAGRLNWQTLTPPEYAQRDEQAMAEIAARGTCTSYEKAYIHKQGHRVPILLGAGALAETSEAGVFFTLDLTERKQAEVALQEQTRLLQVILSSIGDGLILANRQGEFVLFNQAAERLFGRLSNDQPCDEWSRTYGLFLPDQQTLFPDEQLPLARAIQGESANDVEIFVRRHPASPGRWVSISGFPVTDQSRVITGGVITCRDISDRKQADAALRESENRLRLALKSAELGTWDFNPITGELQWDNQCKAMFGLSPEVEMTYDIFLAGLHPDDRDRTNQVVQCSLNPDSGGEYDIEYRTIGLEDGVERWIAAKGKAFFNAAGVATRFIGTVLNRTEKKRAEAEREQLLQREQAAREEAEVANRIKDEFLAVLSHELRTPLNPILGWSRLLQQGTLDAANTTMAIATIERNAKLQAQLIEDLLDISRILQGKMSLTVATVDLNAVIAAALETVRLAAEAKSIQIQTIVAPIVGRVVGDAGRLQQVMWNLLSNAVKFTPQDGHISIALSQVELYAQIQVSDSGKGIHAAFLPHVFAYFRQEDGATTRKFGGLGLGLAIAHQIIEMHGGTITAASAGEGQGATFTIQLPLAPQLAALPTVAPPPVGEHDLSGIHVLLVDDERDSRDFVAFVLQQANAIVTAVASGIEALQAIAQSSPTLIISDIGMPVMDGYRLMQQIRALPSEQSKIPAIALTAYAGELNEQLAIAAGFQHHLPKPVDAEKLISTIGLLCPRSNRSADDVKT